MSGKPVDKPAWSAEDFAAMGAFMESFNKDWPSRASSWRRGAWRPRSMPGDSSCQNGVPIVTDGPYAETQEVLAGYWIVDCESFDRATAIAARLSSCPGPAGASEPAADVRPIIDSRADLEL